MRAGNPAYRGPRLSRCLADTSRTSRVRSSLLQESSHFLLAPFVITPPYAPRIWSGTQSSGSSLPGTCSRSKSSASPLRRMLTRSSRSRLSWVSLRLSSTSFLTPMSMSLRTISSSALRLARSGFVPSRGRAATMVVCCGTDETTSRDAACRFGSRSYQWSLLAPDGFALRSAKLGSVPSAYIVAARRYRDGSHARCMLSSPYATIPSFTTLDSPPRGSYLTMCVKMLLDTTEDVRRHEGRYPFVSISQFSVHLQLFPMTGSPGTPDTMSYVPVAPCAPCATMACETGACGEAG